MYDFIHGLVPAQEKTASSLELEAFEHLLAQPDEEEEKVAYGMMGGGSEDWLSRFQHTPLYEKAIALKEKDLALEKRRMEERQRREKAYRHDDSTWNEQDKLCLEKDKLTLELHKWRASQEAKSKLKMQVMKVAGNGDPLREHDKRLGRLKKAGIHDRLAELEERDARQFGYTKDNSILSSGRNRGIAGAVAGGATGALAGHLAKGGLKGKLIGGAIGTALGGYGGYQMGKARENILSKKAELVEYTGHVNNGEPQAPEWPRAALGVDSAGRRATPEELRPQTIARNPDVQHVTPQSGGEEFERKVSSLVVKLAGLRLKVSNVLTSAVKTVGRDAGAATNALRKKLPTATFDTLGYSKHLAKTDPRTAVKAAITGGMPVTANANTLAELERTSFFH
jgi:hypothetical protein